MAATRAKPLKKTPRKRKHTPVARPPEVVPRPPPPDPSVQEMRAEAARADAKRRVAAFMERTANLPWMRARFGSFETALLGGLRNLLEDAEKDESESRSSESRSAHYMFLYGLFTSLRHFFFWKAMQSRLSDVSRRLQRPSESHDAELVMHELEVHNSAASRDDVQAHFRRLLASPESEVAELRKRVMEQAHAYDVLNVLKDIPKA